MAPKRALQNIFGTQKVVGLFSNLAPTCLRDMFRSFWYNTGVRRTDGQTDGHTTTANTALEMKNQLKQSIAPRTILVTYCKIKW